MIEEGLHLHIYSYKTTDNIADEQIMICNIQSLSVTCIETYLAARYGPGLNYLLPILFLWVAQSI